MPTPVISTIYGPLISLWNVEQAVISTLLAPPLEGTAPRLVYYLAEVERQNGIVPRTLPVPPADDSYYGGLDALSWIEASLPSLIVAVKPEGPPERMGAGDYGQMFQIAVTAIVAGEHEDAARQIAQHYGTAIQGAILQRGSLGLDGAKTTLAGSPDVTFTEQDTRRFMQVALTFHTWVPLTVSEANGPLSVPRDPYTPAGDWPLVQDTNVTVSPLA